MRPVILLQAAGCRRLSLAAAAMLFSLASGGAQQTAGAPAVSADNKPAAYVGSVTCQTCHEDIYKAFQQNPHQEVETDKKRGFEKNACESCHGPAGKHVESVSAADIRQPAKLRPAEADRICLTCHQNQPTHAGRINSSHAKNQVACVACHSIHKNGPQGLVPRTPTAVNSLCAGCHAAVWASFQRPYRHRLPEGAMSCVDCHNPHGSLLPHMPQTFRGNEPGCFNCHGEKAGPFIFPHAAVNLEGCGACHQPHGSANPRMLTRPQVRFVCLECHANPPTPTPAATLGTSPPAFHDLRSPRFQNCTLCHQKVHGSYINRDLLK
ncbi:MAG TPA: DmsE family decaheme c-type cytochrome [Bryobacteraceae bacterium]|nr:DmsE family decaheme c-type cytochrome [Bryobacteraceae bacterium]